MSSAPTSVPRWPDNHSLVMQCKDFHCPQFATLMTFPHSALHRLILRGAHSGNDDFSSGANDHQAALPWPADLKVTSVSYSLRLWSALKQRCLGSKTYHNGLGLGRTMGTGSMICLRNCSLALNYHTRWNNLTWYQVRLFHLV